MEIVLIPLRTDDRPGRLHVADHPVTQLVLAHRHAVGKDDAFHPVAQVFVKLADKPDLIAVSERDQHVVPASPERRVD